jgi:hypothetical protein
LEEEAVPGTKTLSFIWVVVAFDWRFEVLVLNEV